MSFTSLKDLIPKTANKFQLQGEMKAALVINRASALVKEIFREEISPGIRVKKLVDGVLWIAVTSSSLAHEVLLKSLKIRNGINASLDEDIVKNIRTFQETDEQEEDHS